MSTAIVSAKGWVVVPAPYRKKYRLVPGTRVEIVDYGGVLAVVPELSDPVRDAQGILKGTKSLSKALLDERRRNRRRETAR